VVGVDVRLADVEQILFSQQWGNLYSFMTNNEGEVIIHPRLTPAAQVWKKIDVLYASDAPIPLFTNQSDTDIIYFETG